MCCNMNNRCNTCRCGCASSGCGCGSSSSSSGCGCGCGSNNSSSGCGCGDSGITTLPSYPDQALSRYPVYVAVPTFLHQPFSTSEVVSDAGCGCGCRF